MRILIVEDNPKLAESMGRGLEECGYAVDLCHTGFEGEDRAAGESFDVIVLDLMLPDRDGIDICRNLRRRKIATPILMLTALAGTKEKVTGLDAGADDYLAKPFDFDELVARIRALMRRGEATESTVLSCADLTLDLVKRTADRDGVRIELSNKEFALLECLMRNPNRVLTRQSIAEKVWGMNYDPTSNVIDVYISALRRRLDNDFERKLIHTIVGAGYRFGIVDEPAGEQYGGVNRDDDSDRMQVCLEFALV